MGYSYKISISSKAPIARTVPIAADKGDTFAAEEPRTGTG
jgi:hypothetical protein